MTNFQPYFTADGSIGLYNRDFKDIYHSATGALTEAYEKFVYPINFNVLLRKKNIKVLDICYGIGYNTKSFLNFIFDVQNFSKKNNLFKKGFASIYTDNILDNADKNLCIDNTICNDTIYTDNIFEKISITAIDNDKNLLCLSPFIKTGIKKIKIPENLPVDKKFYNDSNKIPKKKINNLINFYILDKIYREILQNQDVTSILTDPSLGCYFEGDLKGILLYLKANNSKLNKLLNLHNIYYRYLSGSYKKGLKSTNLASVNFKYKIEDARFFVKNDNNEYNLIFLDAFSPNKCPCLWSYEFFKELFRILEFDGMILTYSTSASVRSAMIEAGFKIGNIYNKRLDKFTGTIAVKNQELIKYPLSEFDFGLLKTRAGIFYRDSNLNGQNDEILEAHNFELKNSQRESSTHYIKNYKCNNKQ